MFTDIILNVPHSSIERCYDGWDGSFNMFPVIKRWTDWHTDLLFSARPELTSIKMVRFPYSRFYCDAERLINDPLEEVGEGIIYTSFNGFNRTISDHELIMSHWYNHNRTLSGLINNAENPIVIDCHSFPSDMANIVDVCIGYNDDESKPDKETLDIIVNHFLDKGYNVDINSPYSNSITPRANKPYKSFMIEVNKKCYMDENTLELIQNKFMRMQRSIESLYLLLLNNEK